MIASPSTNVWERLAASADPFPGVTKTPSDAVDMVRAQGYQLVPTPVAVLHDFRVGEVVDVKTPEWISKLTKKATAGKPVLEAITKALELDVPTRGVILALLTKNDVLMQGVDGRVWVQRVLGGMRPGSGEPTLTRISDDVAVSLGTTGEKR